MFKLFLSITIYFSFIFISYADHGPKKMWKKNIKPFFNLHETKMMGPFKINVHTFGDKKNFDAMNVKKANSRIMLVYLTSFIVFFIKK